MKPYYSDEQIALHHGDSLAVLRTLPDASVGCCVTSPPYFGLRDYGTEGQYGLEASPAEYVETMRALFAEVRRVLADEGTLWLNLGDSYSSAAGGAPQSGNIETNGGDRFRRPRAQDFVPPKNLLGIPWRTAFALQDDGWILRNDIIWAKSNGMPTSVADRFATKHEHVFLFSKHPRYWFDVDAVRVPHAESSLARFAAGFNPQTHPSAVRVGGARDGIPIGHIPSHGTNPGDVWVVNSQPFTEAHFAVMPPELAERAILAGCKPGGTVLDPFSGSGTTGLAATKHGRKYVGIDLSADYLDLSLRTRFAERGFDFGEVGA
jgi:DNA modification methylase